MDEGYIKFNCKLIPTNDIPLKKVAVLNVYRDSMYKKGMIGVYPDGIGYGNISMRYSENKFLISGTGTACTETSGCSFATAIALSIVFWNQM